MHARAGGERQSIHPALLPTSVLPLQSQPLLERRQGRQQGAEDTRGSCTRAAHRTVSHTHTHAHTYLLLEGRSLPASIRGMAETKWRHKRPLSSSKLQPCGWEEGGGCMPPPCVTPRSCAVACPTAVSFPAAPRQHSQPRTHASTTGGDGAAVQGGHAQPEDLLPSPHPHHWVKKAERAVLAFKTRVNNSPQARGPEPALLLPAGKAVTGEGPSPMEPAPSSPRLHSHRSGAGRKGWASTGDMSTNATAAGELHTSENTHAHEQQLLGSYTHTCTHNFLTTAAKELNTTCNSFPGTHTSTSCWGISHAHTQRL